MRYMKSSILGGWDGGKAAVQAVYDARPRQLRWEFIPTTPRILFSAGL
ncbi:hypothetical protein [Corallococcus macrosporus]|nr:hypothetical protein [Corallococcus macrosporus]